MLTNAAFIWIKKEKENIVKYYKIVKYMFSI